MPALSVRTRTRLGAALLLSLGFAPALLAQTPTDSPSSPGAVSGEEVRFETSDGITVFGDLFRSEESHGRPLILLFHQGGASARGEYAPLIPRLLAEGFTLLAIDQRRGGDRFGGENRTIAGLGDREFTYCQAYADLEAALAYARRLDPPVRPALWGSSYSAALVIRLAAEHSDEVSAVLAFSPASGEAMAGCRPEPYGEDLPVPLLVLRPVEETEIPTVAGQLETFRGQGHQTYVADPGVHGSSMLVPERLDGDVDETWAVVLGFLAGVRR